MTVADELRKKIGAERYDEASQQAKRLAPTTGLGGPEDTKIPAVLEKAVAAAVSRLGEASRISERIALAKEIYPDLPTYSLLSHLCLDYSDFSEADRTLFWDFVCDSLASSSDAIARPFEYLLWVKFFENEETVTDAWSRLVGRSLPDSAIARVLGSSGPVPYGLKEALYEVLIAEKKWHPAIFKSLWGSTADVFGKILPRKALGILARLELPGQETESAELKEALEGRPELEIAGLALLPPNLLALVTSFLVGEPLDLDSLGQRQKEVFQAIEKWKASRPAVPNVFEGAFDLALRFNQGEIKKRVNVRLGLVANMAFLLSVDEEAPKKAPPAPEGVRSHFDDLKKVFRAFTKEVWLRGEYEHAITKLLWVSALQYEAVSVRRKSR